LQPVYVLFIFIANAETEMNYKRFRFYSLLIAMIVFMIVNNISCSTGKKEFTIQGTVQSTENGKDGYTATLKADDGSDFDAVFSQVKLGDQYRVFTVGERLRVAGDTMHLDNKLRVIVSKINP